MGPVCGESCENSYRVEGREPPCEKCRKQPLEKNREAVDIYMKIQNQVIVAGMGEVIGLNYTALDYVMNLYGVRDRRKCFEKVLLLFNTVQENRKDK